MEVMSTPTAELGSSEKDVAPKRNQFMSEDERRITGGGRPRHDPGEIRIPIPGSNRATNVSSKGGIPRGPQPVNTLSSNARTRTPNTAHSSRANTHLSSSQGLEVRVSRGDNVKQLATHSEEHGNLEGPPTKRRKTAPIILDESAQTASSDTIDELSLQNNDLTPSLVHDNRRPSVTSSFQSHDADQSRPHKEYYTVENMMHSGRKRSRKRSRRKSPTMRSDGGEKPRLPSTSMTNAIDLSDEDSLEAQEEAPTAPNRYRGTANETHKEFFARNNESKSKAEENVSRYFNNRPPALPVASKLNRQMQHDLIRSSESIHGNLKNGHAASSPDVLASATTVGAISRQPSPSKSSSSKQNGSISKAEEARLPSSMFPPSTFGGATRRSKSSGATRPTQPSPEVDAAWAVRLSAVRVDNRLHSSTSLGLQYQPAIAAFDVIEGAKNWGADDSSFRVRPEKLRKVLWSISGTFVRFESARSGGADPVLDIELSKERDVSTLLQKIQVNHQFKVTGQSPEHMKKLLDNRLSQQRPSSTTKSLNRSIAVDEGEDVRLMERQKALRDASRKIHGHEEPTSKRRRLEPRTVDLMKDGPRNHGVFEYQWEKTKNPQHAFDHDNNVADDVEDELPDLRPLSPSRISSIVKSLAPKPQTTYSTRSRSEKTPGVLQTSTSALDEPAAVRYSKTHNMGKAWSKPLTYPNTGKKKATVEWADLERLDEGEFFNDTLIEFYLRYLQHQVELNRPNLAKKIHFFNTFFFKNLTHNGRSPAAKANNYRMVEKWTRNVGLFEKDFVVIPINEAFHWYVVVICNLPALNRPLGPLGENGPSSPSGDIDPALRDQHGVRSSPTIGHSPTDEQAEKSSERDTRESLEHLSLEQDNGGTNGKGETSVGPGLLLGSDDQEMLDTQLNSDLTQAGDVSNGIDQLSKAANTTVNNENDAEEDLTPKTADSKKKGKRKSIPPGKKLDPSQPAIVTFDSLGTSHSPTIRVIKDYLLAEAENKGTNVFDEKRIKGMNAVGIPKQNNYCDCGPFLLGYMDKFMEDPHAFMAKVLQKQLDEKTDWPPLGPSKLRTNIRDLLFRLHGEQEDERRESAKKSGKYRSRQSDSSPTRAPEPKAKPTVAMLNEPSKPPQSEPVEEPAASVLGKPAKQVSRSASPAPPSTRNEALKNALPIDAPEDGDPPKPQSKPPQDPNNATPSWKTHPIVVIDSQSQPHSRPTEPSASPPPQSQLPSTIQDSQPPPSPERLEEDSPATPTHEQYEGPPEPVSIKIDTRDKKPRKRDRDTITIDTRGSKQSREQETGRTLRSSPRSAIKSKRTREPEEVIDLD